MATRKKSTSRKSSKRRYGKGASKSVESAMRRRKGGTLRRGKGGRGGKVKSRAQAVWCGKMPVWSMSGLVMITPLRSRAARRASPGVSPS